MINITFPGPGTFWSCKSTYDLSGDWSLAIPKVLPLSFAWSTDDLRLYLVAGGLHVNVLVKSDFCPYPNEVFLFDN